MFLIALKMLEQLFYFDRLTRCTVVQLTPKSLCMRLGIFSILPSQENKNLPDCVHVAYFLCDKRSTYSLIKSINRIIQKPNSLDI